MFSRQNNETGTDDVDRSSVERSFVLRISKQTNRAERAKGEKSALALLVFRGRAKRPAPLQRTVSFVDEEDTSNW